MELDRDLTIKETAELFSVSAETIYKMLRQGKLTSYTVGGTARRVHVEAIRAIRDAETPHRPKFGTAA